MTANTYTASRENTQQTAHAVDHIRCENRGSAQCTRKQHIKKKEHTTRRAKENNGKTQNIKERKNERHARKLKHTQLREKNGRERERKHNGILSRGKQRERLRAQLSEELRLRGGEESCERIATTALGYVLLSCATPAGCGAQKRG